MVFIHSYFYKPDLITFAYANTNFFQTLFYRICEDFSPILCRKYQVIQQQTFIVAFVDMFIFHNASQYTSFPLRCKHRGIYPPSIKNLIAIINQNQDKLDKPNQQ